MKAESSLPELIARAKDLADKARAASSDPLVHANGEALAAAYALAKFAAPPRLDGRQNRVALLREVLDSIRAVKLAVNFAVVEERDRERLSRVHPLAD